MSMLGTIWRGDSVHIGSVCCRGGGDALRARRRFEAAMDDISDRSVGLPAGALLLIARLAPATPLNARAGTGRFVETVRTDLARTLRAARRPWIEGGAAASGEAVLFADEAELAACLIRDWLRGCALERWWWRAVLGTLSISEWLRRNVIMRGELLAATTELATAAGFVESWYLHIQSAEVADGRTALATAYGVEMEGDAAVNARDGPPRIERRVDDEARRTTRVRQAAVQPLLKIAPEIASCNLTVEQRELLAVSLVVRRRLQWARSSALPPALLALRERPHLVPDATAPTLGESPVVARTQEVAAPSMVQATPVEEEPREVVVPGASQERAKPIELIVPLRESRSPARRQPSAPTQPRLQPHRHEEGQLRPSMKITKSPAAAAAMSDAVTPSEAAVADAPAAAASAVTLPSPPHADAETVQPACSVRTSFGGIFYLLNVALALGLYSDFTAPRGPNLSLSPWDFLSVAGRRWFGREFRKDAVSRVLAELADHPPRRPPLWFRKVLQSMQERVALALETPDPKDVPGRLCRHDAHIYMSASAVDVHLSLAELPIEIRRAGLDRDPGWIPAAGRTVRFHFE